LVAMPKAKRRSCRHPLDLILTALLLIESCTEEIF